MMRKTWPVFLALCVTLVSLWVVSSTAIAMDQCGVVGESYSITLDDGEWFLTDFTNVAQFSPAPPCGGYVSLISPDGVWYSFIWCANKYGLMIEDLPAILTEQGLSVYCAPALLFE